MLTDKQTKNSQTNGRNYTNFERNLAMMVIYLSVKIEFDWTNSYPIGYSVNITYPCMGPISHILIQYLFNDLSPCQV